MFVILDNMIVCGFVIAKAYILFFIDFNFK